MSKGGSAAATEQAGPSFELLESKLRPPQLHPNTVPRTSLLEALEAPAAPRVVLVAAPPGYGKTTLLAQWASRSQRPFGWVSLDDQDNDPVVLLRYIATALDRISPLDPAIFDALGRGASIETTIIPRLGSALAEMEDSFVLVLDDLHSVTNPQCLDAIDALIDQVPEGSQLALCGRAGSRGRLAALRARGLLHEIGPDELRMRGTQAGELLGAADVEVSDAELAELVERTEGWPAGLYLAALATRRGGEDPAERRHDLSGR